MGEDYTDAKYCNTCHGTWVLDDDAKCIDCRLRDSACIECTANLCTRCADGFSLLNISDGFCIQNFWGLWIIIKDHKKAKFHLLNYHFKIKNMGFWGFVLLFCVQWEFQMKISFIEPYFLNSNTKKHLITYTVMSENADRWMFSYSFICLLHNNCIQTMYGKNINVN